MSVRQGRPSTEADAVRIPGWEAFAAADRELRAPPAVADAVMRAWTAGPAVVSPRRGPAGRAWMAAAAVLCAFIVPGGLAIRQEAPHQRRPIEPPAVIAPGADAPAASVVAVPNLPAPPRGRERMSAAYRAVARAPEAPLVTLAADPPLDGESLQIVRMRVPREALQAFGISVTGPNLSTVVEVDVVVGGDGLPRDIRTVRSVAGESVAEESVGEETVP
jgi:hypothetical protein